MNEKEVLLKRKTEIEDELVDVEQKLIIINNLEKPYVANVSAYSGHYQTQFKTEEKARDKMDEYFRKQYFKNGLNYGVYLYKWNEDGSRDLLEVKPKGRSDFYPYEFK